MSTFVRRSVSIFVETCCGSISETGGVNICETCSVKKRVLSALSVKLATRISLLAPGEALVVGNLFRFSTLEQTLHLIYAGHIHLDHVDSLDVIDLLGTWRAQDILCSHFGGPGRSS